MRRDELTALTDELHAAGGDAPAKISIWIPTHRHAPDNAQDPIRVRRLAREAKSALDQVAWSREERTQIAKQLDELEAAVESQVGFAHTDLGLACYLVPGTTKVVRLGHTPPEVAIVGDEFSLAPVIADVVSADDIDVLVLSTGGGATDGARLYRMEAGELTEHRDEVFPASFDVRDRETRFAERRVDSPKRDAFLDNFMRRLDDHLRELFGNPHDRAMVVVGIERLRSHWRAVASTVNREAVVAEVDGNVDKTPLPELAARVTEAVVAARQAEATKAVEELADAPRERVAAGSDDVYHLAKDGRVAKLLVAEDASDRVTIDGVVLGDRVARAVKAAYTTGAEIVIVGPGQLDSYRGIAALTRW